MTSVLILAPYFQTRPCSVFIVDSFSNRDRAHDLGWTGNAAGDSGRGGDRRIREVDLGAAGSHTPDKIAVGGRYAALIFAQDTHVATDTGAARRGRDDAIGIHEDLHETFTHHLTLHLLTPGDDDATDVRVDVPPFENTSGLAHVLDPAVGAGADDDLVDRDLTRFGDGTGIFGQRGKSNLRLDSRGIDLDFLLVARIGIARVDGV